MSTKPQSAVSGARVDVWLADWRRIGIDMGVERLSVAERGRLAGFSVERRRRQYIAARVLAYRALDERLGLKAQAVSIAPAGAPVLQGLAHSAGLSIAHCDELAVCALSLGGNVGVDCESIRAGRNRFGIARRYFGAAEYEALRRPGGLGHFNAMWTVKEAIAKAGGGSVLDYLATVATVPLPDGDYSVVSSDPATVGGIALWHHGDTCLAMFIPGATRCPDIVVHDEDTSIAGGPPGLIYCQVGKEPSSPTA